MTVGKGKRPTDPNQLAKWVVEQSVTDPPDALETQRAPSGLSAYMAAIGRKGGKIGGKPRLKTMTSQQRSRVAAKAAHVGS
ncbi:MAG: hypothetical protein WA188_12120 [Terriglobales bacterium]